MDKCQVCPTVSELYLCSPKCERIYAKDQAHQLKLMAAISRCEECGEEYRTGGKCELCYPPAPPNPRKPRAPKGETKWVDVCIRCGTTREWLTSGCPKCDGVAND